MSRIRSPAWPTGCCPKIATASPAVSPMRCRRGIWVGNPVRPEIDRVCRHRPSAAGRPRGRCAAGARRQPRGAALNDVGAPGLACSMPTRAAAGRASGRRKASGGKLQQNYEAAGVRAHCVAFIEDMAGAYEWADLVICRAGALTVAELAAPVSPASWCRFPHAVDDHQTYNARFCRRPAAPSCCRRRNDTRDRSA
jgi:UDP-N-acetylglucosamine--N-acetylmuramyl-(pentapeptide) pyrophosphoryl-undecaprenol N-acetylglucosamine transferase